MLNLLIARHGNTFDKGEVPLRVGCGSDISLSLSGQHQARLLGQFLKSYHPHITTVFTSRLKRTIETAQIALQEASLNLTPITNAMFDEVDYGPDEGKPEGQVIARIGQKALDDWEQHQIVPMGWNIEPQAIQRAWQEFGQNMLQTHDNQTVLVITSNGIARFAPQHKIKLSTGALSSLTLTETQWQLNYANQRPINNIPA